MSIIHACMLVLSGALLIIIARLRFKKTIKLSRFILESRGLIILRYVKAYKFLMSFFVLGYILLVVVWFLKVELIISHLWTSVLLLASSLYIYLGVSLQFKTFMLLKNLHFETIKALVAAIEARDSYTKGHSKHVAELMLLMHKNLPRHLKKGLSSEVIFYSGLLHDVGKIGVPGHILNKTGRLEEDEWEQIKSHTSVGAQILRQINQLSGMAKWINYHHERIDGTGYYGITGARIPLVSKIISVADTFSALVTDRPYRVGKSYHEALDIMKSVSGTQLDPFVLSIFLNIDKDEILDVTIKYIESDTEYENPNILLKHSNN